MHPIERLRYVARASGAPQAPLVRETAMSLGAFADDPAGLVTACRRIIANHPTSGPLWWLCSRVLTGTDPISEAWEAVDALDGDRTARELAHALPADATVCVVGWPDVVGEALVARGDLDVLVVDALGEGSGLVRRLVRSEVDAIDVPMSGLGAAAAAADVVLLEASVVGPTAAMAVAGSRAAAAVAAHREADVWLVAGIGRLVPKRIWETLEGWHDRDDEPWELDEEQVPLDLVSSMIGTLGVRTVEDALRRVDTPIAPELLREGVL
ncbi:MAG: hypothetical protein S0880_03535 [Actinomycetota bacterium]|nr:hypothetical protein [Actinomycetota bacterium]